MEMGPKHGLKGTIICTVIKNTCMICITLNLRPTLSKYGHGCQEEQPPFGHNDCCCCCSGASEWVLLEALHQIYTQTLASHPPPSLPPTLSTAAALNEVEWTFCTGQSVTHIFYFHSENSDSTSWDMGALGHMIIELHYFFVYLFCSVLISGWSLWVVY